MSVLWYYGLRVSNGVSVKATQCEFSENGASGCLFFHHNGNDGVYMYADGVVGYTGGTSWRTNGDSPQQRRRPSLLWFMTMKTMILDTSDSGKIQSQLSSSSLELTVIHPIHVHVAAPDDDEEEDN